MFQLNGLNLGAKAWSALLGVLAWLATNPDVLHALTGFSARHHWALALGVFASYIGHMLYQPAQGAKPKP